MNTFAKSLAASLAGAITASSAQAGILGFGIRGDSVTIVAAPAPVPLRDNDTTTLTFRTVRDNTPIAVTFNAECLAMSSVAGDQVELWISVDGMAQSQEFSFCSALVAGAPVYVAAARRAVVRVAKAGLHTVRVFAKLSEGTTSGQLDDTSIVIED